MSNCKDFNWYYKFVLQITFFNFSLLCDWDNFIFDLVEVVLLLERKMRLCLLSSIVIRLLMITNGRSILCQQEICLDSSEIWNNLFALPRHSFVIVFRFHFSVPIWHFKRAKNLELWKMTSFFNNLNNLVLYRYYLIDK